MLLTGGLDDGASRHDFAGLLPGRCTMTDRVTLGYREVEMLTGTLLGDAGTRLRGHEFHYSSWDRPPTAPGAYRCAPRSPSDEPVTEGYAADNLLASYVHLHFEQRDGLAARFAAACRAWATAGAAAAGSPATEPVG
jgi:cobyrinic acid a,c-diamide synthase